MTRAGTRQIRKVRSDRWRALRYEHLLKDTRAALARLAGLPPGEQEEAVRQVVLTQAALVLAMAGPEAVDAGRSFREMGSESLTAVESGSGWAR